MAYLAHRLLIIVAVYWESHEDSWTSVQKRSKSTMNSSFLVNTIVIILLVRSTNKIRISEIPFVIRSFLCSFAHACISSGGTPTTLRGSIGCAVIIITKYFEIDTRFPLPHVCTYIYNVHSHKLASKLPRPAPPPYLYSRAVIPWYFFSNSNSEIG